MISARELQNFLPTSNVRLEVATPSSRLLFSQAPSIVSEEYHFSWNCIGPQSVRNRHTWATNKPLIRTVFYRIPEKGHILVQKGMQEMCLAYA